MWSLQCELWHTSRSDVPRGDWRAHCGRGQAPVWRIEPYRVVAKPGAAASRTIAANLLDTVVRRLGLQEELGRPSAEEIEEAAGMCEAQLTFMDDDDRECLAVLRSRPRGTEAGLEGWAADLRERAERADAQDDEQEWREWVHRALDGAASAAHTFTKADTTPGRRRTPDDDEYGYGYEYE